MSDSDSIASHVDYEEEGSILLNIQEQVDKLILRVLVLEERIRIQEEQQKTDLLFCTLL